MAEKMRVDILRMEKKAATKTFNNNKLLVALSEPMSSHELSSIITAMTLLYKTLEFCRKNGKICMKTLLNFGQKSSEILSQMVLFQKSDGAKVIV